MKKNETQQQVVKNMLVSVSFRAFRPASWVLTMDIDLVPQSETFNNEFNIKIKMNFL